MTPSGLAFLKCAFAPPDFSVDPGKGIPDRFAGRTVSTKDCLTQSIVFTAERDVWIVVAPVPGYAYFIADQPIGENPVKFTGVPFPTYTSNFGNGDMLGLQYTKFRYASLAAGIYPTSNMMQYGGSISAWRADLTLAETALLPVVGGVPAQQDFWAPSMAGMNSLTAQPPRDNVSHSFIDGMYAYGYDRSGDFEWNPFQYGERFLDNGSSAAFFEGATGKPMTGWGNTNSVVYKITTPAGAVNAAVLKIWNCIEFQPNTNSAIFQFSGLSPEHDPVALEAYNKVKATFPVAVPAGANATFWQTVLDTLHTIFGVVSLVPGPAGMISGGLGAVTAGMRRLFT